jgi:hypothetical protein
MGWGETGPTHGPHGCWPNLAMMLINLPSACSGRGEGFGEKKKRERLAWPEKSSYW